MRTALETNEKNPDLADMIHCILYVISATSIISTEMSPSLKLMKEIKDNQNEKGKLKSVYDITTQ